MNTMTFVDPATGWIEITEILDKISTGISQVFNNTQLAPYPHTRKVIFDNANEKRFPTTIKRFQHQAKTNRHQEFTGQFYTGTCIPSTWGHFVH